MLLSGAFEAATIGRMTKRKTPPVPATAPEAQVDRHKQRGKLLRMDDRLWEQLDKLVHVNASDDSTEIRIAIRKHLVEAGLWPPTPPQPGDND